jgi:hypothetical protein
MNAGHSIGDPQMDKLTVDPATGAKLAGLQHSVELFAASGERLGWFQPAVSPDDYEGLEPPFGEEELRAADQEQGGRSLDEILADLDRRK